MNISVVLWDAGNRDNNDKVTSNIALHHLSKQVIFEDFEIIYVNWEEQSPIVIKTVIENKIKNFVPVDLFRDESEPWHIGKMINEGVAQASGDTLFIMDADVSFGDDWLRNKYLDFRNRNPAYMHVRRKDETVSNMIDPYSLDDISENEVLFRMVNPHNYGPAVVVDRGHFIEVNGYTEIPLFKKDSAVAFEFATRLYNLGLDHLWRDGLYHCWHPNTGAVSPLAQGQMEYIKNLYISKSTKAVSGYGG